MEEERFRKLNVDLPIEPVTDDRPWYLAGWLLAILVVVLIAFAYLLHIGLI